MSGFLTEDQITSRLLPTLKKKEGWEIVSRAKGRSSGADIVASRNKKTICIEAKGGGSQSATSSRFGYCFNRLQCQHNTDVAFACIPQMIARYQPDYVGIALHDDENHLRSINEIMPIIKMIGAGAWVVGSKGVTTLNRAKLLKSFK